LTADISNTPAQEFKRGVDHVGASNKQSCSPIRENLPHDHTDLQTREQLEARELELINRVAEQLSAELEDVLRYQVSNL
jgi:hypothetical protein